MFDRRHLLKTLTATGVGTAVFHRSLAAAVVQEGDLSIESLQQAEWITGLELSDEEREKILGSVKRTNKAFESLREVKTDYNVPMAIQFAPTSRIPEVEILNREAEPVTGLVDLPASDDEIAFLPVHRLSWLVRTKKLSSVRLTNIYLERLKKFAPMLRCVVNLTEELAMEQASKADEEIAVGNYRGPLHGIPWGAKDLIAVEGYPTTWGVPQHEQRELDHTATVAGRLKEAGAVLVAKLSLGALAQGDLWFRGMTRNPWNPEEGSSGSSAGSASAVVAGLVGFALGSETLGSIVSPSRRCGTSSLRPTFGRVSRYGCMPLSWSMDKIGPLCRSVEDCALVFDAIHGSDGIDTTAGSYPFVWPSKHELLGLRVGYEKDDKKPDAEREDLKVIRELGCELVEVKLPENIPFGAFFKIIEVEAASVFDELLRAGKTEGWNTWTASFQSAQFVSAVDYVRIQRVRSKLIQEFEEAIKDVDVLANVFDLLHTNFTGHPCVVLPVGYEDKENGGKSPKTTVITGHLNDDERLLAFARAYQQKVTAHLEHPSLDEWLGKFIDGELGDVRDGNKEDGNKEEASESGDEANDDQQ